jgi:hypothetical protein
MGRLRGRRGHVVVAECMGVIARRCLLIFAPVEALHHQDRIRFSGKPPTPPAAQARQASQETYGLHG